MSRVLPILLSIGLTVYCLIDALQTDEQAMRNLPKPFWLLLILLFPIVGPLAWLFAGRPADGAQTVPRSTPGWLGGGSAGPIRRGPRAPQQAVAPDDDPEFLASLRGLDDEHQALLEKWEADLREREQRLRDDGGTAPDDGEPSSGDGSPPTP